MKVCFLTNGVHNKILYETYAKMTPGRRGVWKDMEGIWDDDPIKAIERADFCIVQDAFDAKIPKDKKIMIGAHPFIMSIAGNVVYEGFDFGKEEAIIKLDLRYTAGFGEWWIDMGYDELMALKPPLKTKELACVISNSETRDYHKLRRNFVDRFSNNYKFDLFGRVSPTGNMQKNYKGYLGSDSPTKDYWHGKEILLDYRYSVEMDAGPCENYFSERFYDAMLLWCMPIYWGGTNVERYLPANSFRYFGIEGNGEDVMEIVKSDFREKHLKDMAEARDLLLNKYQIWAMVYSEIKKL